MTHYNANTRNSQFSMVFNYTKEIEIVLCSIHISPHTLNIDNKLSHESLYHFSAHMSGWNLGNSINFT